MREIRCSVSIYHADHLNRAEFIRELESLGYDLVSTNTETKPDLHVELSGEMPESDFAEQTLQRGLVRLAEKFNVDLLGVLYDQTDQEQYPFVGGKNGDARRHLESEYVVQAAMKALSDLGRQSPPSLALAIHSLLENRPLRAVLYQSGGTNEGLKAEAPIQLLVVDEKDAYAELFSVDGKDQESVVAEFDEFSQHF
ncbi:hypothetical protein [Acidithiobacillus caldus]|jgi:hypothetical protein|uniref:Uncharacterized protein n=2 Tax=Acidithiobacillus caldus TaxID=33059 RepID=A0A059ZYP9_ACICK|nr:hypothetical protein [Acidithiobacillus caldus]AIA56583.1 hypothetical protein Acaty_m0010 [Acidithiobacillus caldus ATCC 51756]MBU2730315.1 hypothetical protein [Acidithiobacillus caldus]MBU2736070.1 hypothetical protein [Acidithiobacillus caldus ATCC 51756]MBU2746568.1 hypothetical protein [Acidithiobacillus caldus]MBU2780892.1 hypothetical protein [Acidithiobacillus caldus]